MIPLHLATAWKADLRKGCPLPHKSAATGHSRELHGERKLQCSPSNALLSFGPFVLRPRLNRVFLQQLSAPFSPRSPPPFYQNGAIFEVHFEAQRGTKGRSVIQTTDSRPHKKPRGLGIDKCHHGNPQREEGGGGEICICIHGG